MSAPEGESPNPVREPVREPVPEPVVPPEEPEVSPAAESGPDPEEDRAEMDPEVAAQVHPDQHPDRRTSTQDPSPVDPVAVFLHAALDSLKNAHAELPGRYDLIRALLPVLDVLGDINEEMKSLLADVRAAIGIPPVLVDEDGLPENERASELEEIRSDIEAKPRRSRTDWGIS